MKVVKTTESFSAILLPRAQDKREYWGKFKDNFSYFSMKTHAVNPH